MKNKIFSIISLVVALVSLGLVFILQPKESVYFVDTNLLVQKFSYSVELNEEISKVRIQNESLLKDLSYEHDSLIDKINSSKNVNYDNDRARILEIEKKINEIYESFENLQIQYNTLIIERLNSYVYEYGVENDIKIILGASGDGNIMYADDEIDITQDVLTFINNKYEGN